MADNNNQQQAPQGQPNTGAAGSQANGQQQENNQQDQQAPPAFDYEKLASIISGKQSVAEDSVLKGYFKQQGLSKEEMDQAIQAFKQQKAANTPDANALQTQLTAAWQQARQAQLENAAVLQAVGLGVDAKVIPYLLKMTDLTEAVGQDGKISEDSIKTALNKTLEDIPALKPAPASQTGFVQIGSGGSGAGQKDNEEALKGAFGL